MNFEPVYVNNHIYDKVSIDIIVVHWQTHNVPEPMYQYRYLYQYNVEKKFFIIISIAHRKSMIDFYLIFISIKYVLLLISYKMRPTMYQYLWWYRYNLKNSFLWISFISHIKSTIDFYIVVHISQMCTPINFLQNETKNVLVPVMVPVHFEKFIFCNNFHCSY